MTAARGLSRVHDELYVDAIRSRRGDSHSLEWLREFAAYLGKIKTFARDVSNVAGLDEGARRRVMTLLDRASDRRLDADERMIAADTAFSTLHEALDAFLERETATNDALRRDWEGNL